MRINSKEHFIWLHIKGNIGSLASNLVFSMTIDLCSYIASRYLLTRYIFCSSLTETLGRLKLRNTQTKDKDLQKEAASKGTI